jgi:hypothetical protein
VFHVPDGLLDGPLSPIGGTFRLLGLIPRQDTSGLLDATLEILRTPSNLVFVHDRTLVTAFASSSNIRNFSPPLHDLLVLRPIGDLLLEGGGQRVEGLCVPRTAHASRVERGGGLPVGRHRAAPVLVGGVDDNLALQGTGLPERLRKNAPRYGDDHPLVSIAANYTTSREPIHHAVRFSFDTPTTCGKQNVPKPAASEWRYVDCPKCLALKPPEVHAKPSAEGASLCGLGPDVEGRWTTRRSEVRCEACAREIERRRTQR